MAASLSFDAETFQPTYHLIVGEVGASFGIKIAEKVGIPQEVIRAAFGFLRSEEVELNELLLSLSREREKFKKLVLEFEEKLAELGRERKELEALRKSLEEERRYVLKAFRKDMEAYLKEKKEEIARLVGELRKVRELDEEKYQVLRAVMAKEEQGIEALGEEPKKETESFRVGDEVFVEPLGSGVVLEVDAKRKEVLVEVGERRVRVAPERLKKEKREVLSSPLSTPVAAYTPEKRTTNEISIRALRAEEALEVLEKYLDRAILAGFTTVYVIHGKGEGKLRKVTHEFLRNHPYVQDFRLGRPEEGGVGVTVVTLKS
jgi:DNA mismatch repair protein MutS2